MFDKIGIHDTIILAFFAFLGGLTRELNEVITSKLNLKAFILGLITASTTGIIVSQVLLDSGLSFHFACFASGISGFMGPYILLALSKIVERKLETYGTEDMNKAYKAARDKNKDKETK